MIFYKNGIQVSTHSAREIDISHLQHTRRAGDIKGFSLHSRSRLRRALLSYDIPGSIMFGLTLTLPPDGQFAYATPYAPRKRSEKESSIKSKKTTRQKAPKQDIAAGENLNECESFKKAGFALREFPDTLRRFTIYFQRRFPQSGFIWRVELQQRGAPHLHCVAYLHQSDYALQADLPPTPNQGRVARDYVRCIDLYYDIAYLWCKSVFETAFIGSPIEFEHWFDNQSQGNGLNIQTLPSTSSALRYICDHASKRKQAQLGYRGRQWGLCGRRRFVQSSGERVLSEGDARIIKANRVLRKLRRYRIRKDDAPFGSKRTRANARAAANAITFCSSDTREKLRRYLEIDSPIDDETFVSRNSSSLQFLPDMQSLFTPPESGFLSSISTKDWP